MADSQGNDNSTCVVCFKNVLYYSIGECDHPVCFECSTRMRVLCLQNECPICRQSLSRVVFTESIQSYKELRNRAFSDKMFERQFKIGFCSDDIKAAYERLLENICKLCDKMPPFRSFTSLSDHMRKVHERYFCDLCVKHLKIFTSERRCYTRQELAHHRRKGDLDDTSHRGHPLCEFCEDRFMDADELYRHLRKEHLYCHLCDADGRNYYYASHSALAQHFRTDHFLCEEGECAGQHLTAVFRSEIDLKAHKAGVHGKGLTRGAARQARTLELQFNITPHPVAQRNHQNSRQQQQEIQPPPSPVQVAPPHIDTRSDEQFPRLSAAAPAPVLMGGPSARTYKGSSAFLRTEENFPSLGGSNSSRPSAPSSAKPAPVAATLVRNSKPSVSIQLHSQPASASNFRLTQPTGNRISIPPQHKRPPILDDDDFPVLNMPKDDHPSIGAGTVQPAKMTLINSDEMQALRKKTSSNHAKKPQISSEAFPALSSASTPTTPPQWIKVSKTKEKAKPKPEPSPPREANFTTVADFPTLPVNTKSKSKKPAPAPQLTTNQSQVEVKTNSKKEKKKNNTKKENSEANMNSTNDKKNRGFNSILSTVNNNQSNASNKNKIADTTNVFNENNGGNGDFALKTKDYPPLGGKDVKNKAPNGSVPPGFGKSRPACDGLKFTNSSGQTFSAPLHAYIPPTDFEQRNRTLVKKFAVALGGAANVEDFKVASRAFRDSIITAEEFYKHCQMALGSQLESVFPELVALLPDIAKQQELVIGRKVASQLAVCPTCGQLIAPSDKIAHDTAHWPPLATR